MSILIEHGITIEQGIDIASPIGGSLLFGTTSSYVLANGIPAPGTDACTYEMFFYPTALALNNVTLNTRTSGLNFNTGMVWTMYSNMYNIYGNQLVLDTNPVSPNLNAWNHVALTIATGHGTNSARFWVNGTLRGTFTNDSTLVGSELALGGRQYGGITGYISNFRYVKGTEVYTGNFTPPTQPLTDTQSAGTNISAILPGQTQLLLKMSSPSTYLTDSSSYARTVTATGTVTQDPLNPFF